MMLASNAPANISGNNDTTSIRMARWYRLEAGDRRLEIGGRGLEIADRTVILSATKNLAALAATAPRAAVPSPDGGVGERAVSSLSF
jgi:hypothetical protein